MRLAVFGSGALGSLFTARLTPHIDCTLVGHWPAQMAALQQQALTLRERDGTERQLTVQSTSLPETLGPIDVALVLVKSPQTARSAHEVARCLASDGLAITLQNGLGNDIVLGKVLGRKRVVAGITSIGAYMVAPGIVQHAGEGIVLLASDAARARRIQAVADLFNQAGLTTELGDNVIGLIWQKVAVNAAINPLTALLDVANGRLLDDDRTVRLMNRAAAEAAAVADAAGVVMPDRDVVALSQRVAQLTDNNVSSMRQDVRNGRPTEIDAICGAVATTGAQLGVNTTINSELTRLVHERSAGRLPDNWLAALEQQLIAAPPITTRSARPRIKVVKRAG